MSTSHPKDKDDHERIKNKVKQDIIEEEKRLLYVALTRAKEQLFITGKHDKKIDLTSKNAQNYYQLLFDRAEITDSEITFNFDTTSFTFKNHQSLDAHDNSNYSKNEILKLSPSSQTPALQKTFYSVTELIKLITYANATHHQKTASPIGVSDNQITATKLGIIMHAYLESINLNNSFDLESIMFTLYLHSSAMSEIEGYLNQISQSYKSSDWYELIKTSSKHYHEYSFQIKLDTIYIEGRFDSILQINDQWKILDYKLSSHLDSVEYKTQMQLYIMCLSIYKNIPVSQITATLINPKSLQSKTYSFNENDLLALKRNITSIITMKNTDQLEFDYN